MRFRALDVGRCGARTGEAVKRRAVTRALAGCAVVVGLASLGDLRSPADAAAPFRSSREAPAGATSAPDVRAEIVARLAIAANGDPEDVASEVFGVEDRGRVVPAIYAPDPDVRVGRFHRVRRWM